MPAKKQDTKNSKPTSKDKDKGGNKNNKAPASKGKKK